MIDCFVVFSSPPLSLPHTIFLVRLQSWKPKKDIVRTLCGHLSLEIYVCTMSALCLHNVRTTSPSWDIYPSEMLCGHCADIIYLQGYMSAAFSAQKTQTFIADVSIKPYECENKWTRCSTVRKFLVKKLTPSQGVCRVCLCNHKQK